MSAKTLVLFYVCSAVALLMISCKTATIVPVMAIQAHPATDVYAGWRLGVQAYTFRMFTFFEAIDKTASLGLNWIEAYPGQKLRLDRPEETLIHTMSAESRQAVRDKLHDAGIKLVNYGVVGLSNDEAQCRQVFGFAAEMGIETIVSEPPADAFDLIDRLCHEYQIKVAIHNHPDPSPYWHPDRVLEVLKGRSQWIGACADTGHWLRSGIHPLRAIKKLKGRIISLHFKDLNEFANKNAHDVPWGTGTAGVNLILQELHRQKFHGVFSVEYEHNWDNSVPEIRQSVGYFNRVASQLNPTGWHNLFDDDLANAIFNDNSWTLDQGVLTLNGGGDIWTKDTYGNFVLDVGFKLAEQTNSGIFIRSGNTTDWLPWVEVQVLNSADGEPSRHACGAIYDVLAPSKMMAKESGQWNRLTIAARHSRVNVVMNGEQIIDMDLNRWIDAHLNPDGSENKFDIAYRDLPRVGHFGFQDHGNDVWYRNVKIKSLDP